MDITTIINLQKTEKLSDPKMALRIGITREYYNRVKKGRLPLTDSLRVKIVKAFPSYFVKNGIPVA